MDSAASTSYQYIKEEMSSAISSSGSGSESQITLCISGDSDTDDVNFTVSLPEELLPVGKVENLEDDNNAAEEIAASFNDSPSDLYVYNLNAEGDVVKGVLRNYDDNDVQSQSNNSSSDEIVRSTKRLRRISTSSGSLTDPDQPVALNISKRDQNYNLKKRLKALSFKFRKHQDFYDLFKRFPDKILKYLNRLQKKENDNKLIIKKLMVYGESLDLNGKNVISHEARTTRSCLPPQFSIEELRNLNRRM